MQQTLEQQNNSLRITLAALVRRYGTPEATVPWTVVLAIPAHELEAASRLHFEITPVQHDVDPQPFLQLTLIGG